MSNISGYITLSFPDYILDVTNLIISPINFLICLIFLPLIITFEYCHFHINFCILRFVELLAFALISISTLFIIILMFIENIQQPVKYFILWKCFYITGFFGMDLLRCLWLGISIERAVATAYRDVYEKKRSLTLSILLLAILVLVAIVLTLCRFQWTVNLYALYGTVMFIDLSGILSIYILTIYNRNIRKLYAKSVIILTQRYQLAENTKVLKSILPILKIGVLITSSTTILRIFALKLSAFKWLFPYSIPFTFLLFNVYIMIANFLWVVNNSSYRVYIKQWMDKFFPENKEPSQSQNQEIKIINVEGKIIPSKSTVDSHHNMMKKVWS